MNISEANAWFAVIRGLLTEADAAERERAVDGARMLTERARSALGVGPFPAAVAIVTADVQALLDTVDDELGLTVALIERPVEVATTVGDVL